MRATSPGVTGAKPSRTPTRRELFVHAVIGSRLFVESPSSTALFASFTHRPS
jgi:hypothetical protein